ncbi:MAG: hypothetical protein ACJ8CB_26265 [Ktedonobacteraceae bacterium]
MLVGLPLELWVSFVSQNTLYLKFEHEMNVFNVFNVNVNARLQ